MLLNALPVFWPRKYEVEVVENERPADAKNASDVVEKKLFCDL